LYCRFLLVSTTSPKRARTDFTESNTEETSEGFVQGSQTESVRHLTNCETIPENEPVEQESEEDSDDPQV
jgi:hypothetical protein